jgi:predicted ATPase
MKISSPNLDLPQFFCFHSQADLAANIFTGEEEQFAFERTKSRLTEMQTAEYWQLWSKNP